MRRLLLVATLFAGLAQAAEPLTIDVHRDPNCGCCKAWIKHLESNGFVVRDHVESDMAAFKTAQGVPHRLGSCHTGVIDGKFVEGHVPASEVRELVKRDDLIGAAVPGMPAGSPGMDMGDRQDAYQVIGLTESNGEQVLAEYPAR
ncbi:DUF411 domain-containing protein [Stutzerimonas urumqiensis]|uniref:DUF411 domain-containing protein n=1 Tax=Stutzerimonas urumqiensis TaxID=638269 RepID=UPI000EB53192|nr:DUF411 domain-containing protein [Stutzerimonas urumqiensis]